MRVLITGGTGLLGKALIESKRPQDGIAAAYWGSYTMPEQPDVRYLKLDITDEAGHEQLFSDFKPQIVIHTACIASPDYAQQNKEQTWAVNVKGTENLVHLCNRFGAKFIFISSNGIYDGNHAPYTEEDQALPVNYYGETKVAGERCAQQAKNGYAIVRPILMYGWPHPIERGNIVTGSLLKLRKNEKVNAYDDVFSNPLLSNECARAIWTIIDKDLTGSFNIAGSERVSIFDLLKTTAKVFDCDEGLVHPVQQGFFNELVPRPKDTSYNTHKMETVLGIKPLSVEEGLRRMKAAAA